MLRSVAAEVASVARQGIEVAIVVGGGNFFRGVDAWDGLDRATADHMGMLATCMNAICLQVLRTSPAIVLFHDVSHPNISSESSYISTSFVCCIFLAPIMQPRHCLWFV